MFTLSLLSLLAACGSADVPADPADPPAEAQVGGTDVAPAEAIVAPTTWFLLRGSVHIDVVAGDAQHTAVASLYNGGIRTLHPDQLRDATGTTQIVHETWRSESNDALATALADGPFSASPPYLPLQLTQADDGMVLSWTHPRGERQIHLPAQVTAGISTHTVTLGPLSLGEAVTPRERRDIARAVGESQVDDITLQATLTLGEEAQTTRTVRRVPGTLPTGDGDDRPLWDEHPIRSPRSSGPRNTDYGPYDQVYDARAVDLSPENVDASGR